MNSPILLGKENISKVAIAEVRPLVEDVPIFLTICLSYNDWYKHYHSHGYMHEKHYLYTLNSLYW